MDRIAGSGLLSMSCTGVGEGGDVTSIIDDSERDELRRHEGRGSRKKRTPTGQSSRMLW